ncbi:MAG: DNA polymerase/3'-5' exonuclease PolX [Phycisphaerae bacterium]|nr:DNA polymerase/3'-5' exonuclease PolX [Phycisphaerae bacterium]
MVNKELARLFNEIADLMEIKGADAFRINSYRRAARVFKDTNADLADLAQHGTLTSLSGVGKGTAQRVAQYLAEGKIDVHQELLQTIPPGLPALLTIPGLGPKKIALMWREAGVESLDGLEAAIEAGKLEDLPGMGAKTVEKIRQGMAFLAKSSGRTPIGLALPVARTLAEAVEAMPDVEAVSLAGSLRRGRETVGDVDILCGSPAGKKVVKAFTARPEVRQVLADGDTKGSVLVDLPNGNPLQVDLRVVAGESYGAALQYFTGSKEHNVRLRELAIKKGLKLNEYGLFKGDRHVAGRTEKEVYERLGLPLIPPELREDRGEIEAGSKLPKLVELSDIRGDLHLHSPASDGHDSIEDLAETAKKLGYDYIAITDHSKSQTIANGLSIEAMLEHIESIRKANMSITGIAILASTEVDILSDGSLDYPDELLAECDIVIASIHSGLGQPRAKATARTIKAMESPHVHVIGHPTGRLLGKREAMDIDIAAIVQAAVETGTALEINASWQRLDLCDIHIHLAVEAGATLAISTDAHNNTQMSEMMPYGVSVARRGWATRKHILNSQALASIHRFVEAKRT